MGKGKSGGGSAYTPVEQKDNLKSNQVLSIIDLLGEGEIDGPVGGLKGIYLNDTPIENSDGSINFSGVSAQWNVGTQSQSPLKGFSDVQNEVMVSTQVEYGNAITRTVTDPNVDRLRVTVGVSSLYQIEDNGDINGSSVQMNVEIQNESGAWTVAETVNISGKTRSQYFRSIYINDLPPTPFSIRVNRLSSDSSSTKISNNTVFSSYTEIIDSRLRYPNSALCGLIVDAEQFSSVPSRKYLLRGRRIRVPSNYDPDSRAYTGLWDGTFKIAWTNNPAWVFYDLATDVRAGLGRRLGDNVDKWTMYMIAQYCDHIVDDGFGGTEPRFTCNVAITEPGQAYETLNNLCSIFNAMPIWDGMQMSVSADIASDPVYPYTNSNVKSGEFTYQSSPLKSRHTAVHVTWQDPNNGWKSQTEYVGDDEAISRYGLNIKTITAFGCCSRGQALRAGKWLLFTEKNERETVSFAVGRDGLKHLPGDIIETYDNAYSGAHIGGRIVAVDDQLVTLDRDVTYTSGQETFLGYVGEEGKPKRVSIIGQEKTNVLVLSSIVDDLLHFGIWTLSTTALKPRLWRCISIAENDDDYAIFALQHVSGKQEHIDSGVVFEPANTSLYAGNIPVVENVQVEMLPESENVRLTWDTPKTIYGLTFQVRIYRGTSLNLERNTDSTECTFDLLPIGNYTAKIRGKRNTGQLGDETSINFTVAAPATPSDILFDVDNFSVSARPVITGVTSISTQYDWYFGDTRAEVENRSNLLGRAFILNHQARKPDTFYWYGVEAVNAIGRSSLVIRQTKTALNPSDIISIIEPEIPKLDWAKGLQSEVDVNTSDVILLSDRAALVVNQEGRITGLTVTAESSASAIDFLADYVSFTDPDTLERNFYWNNSRRTLVLKGEIELQDGTSLRQASDFASSAGGMFRIETSTGVFPADATATSLFESTFSMSPSVDTVFTVYALDEQGTISAAASKMFNGTGWVTPKLFIDGDVISTGTIRSEHLSAGIDLKSPKIIAGEIVSSEENPVFSITATGVITMSSGYVNNRLTIGNSYIDGRTTGYFIYSNGGKFWVHQDGRAGFAGDITGASGTFLGTIAANKVIGAKTLRLSGTVSGFLTNPVIYNEISNPDGYAVHRPYGEIVIDTGYPIPSWSGSLVHLTAAAEPSGTWYEKGGATTDRWFGIVAEVLPYTRWSGQATIHIVLRIYTRYMYPKSASKINWKLYEIM